MEALAQSLESLSLSGPVPEVGAAEVLVNPLDLCRSYLAQILADIVGCDVASAYRSIQWPNNIFNGDLAVILPKLRPGAKAEEVAVELMEKVCETFPRCSIDVSGQSLTVDSFQKNTRFSFYPS